MPFTDHDPERGDHASFVRLFAELEIPDPVPDVEAFAARIAPQALVLRDETSRSVVAYAWWQRFEGVVHVRHVVVDPAWRGRGAGRFLMDRVAARARAAGCTRWFLNVKPDNVAARRLYERVGLSARFASAALEIDWTQVHALPAGSAAVVSTPAITDDPRLEATFHLAPGQMATLRAEARVLVALSERGAYTGFAAFDPAFPGANPFRASRAEDVRRLLEAMRPHALPAHPLVRFVIDGDAPLVARLCASGARLVMEVLRMEGELAEPRGA